MDSKVDTENLRCRIVNKLPASSRWYACGTPIDFNFARARIPLRTVRPVEFNDATFISLEWTMLGIFGEQDCGEGGGASCFLGVHFESGMVYGLDVERAVSPMFLLNSSVDRFIESFLMLDGALRPGTIPTINLTEQLHRIDPDVFGDSDWRPFCDYVLREE